MALVAQYSISHESHLTFKGFSTPTVQTSLTDLIAFARMIDLPINIRHEKYLGMMMLWVDLGFGIQHPPRSKRRSRRMFDSSEDILV
jgi:hypothetical protein